MTLNFEAEVNVPFDFDVEAFSRGSDQLYFGTRRFPI